MGVKDMDGNSEKFVASQSLAAVFECLKSTKQAAAKEIASATGLSFPTVMSMIRIGLDCGMIVKGEMAGSTGGRCAQIYRCNPDWVQILLLRVDTYEIEYEVRNVLGERLSGGKHSADAARLIDAIADITERAKMIYPHLNLCAVAMPCVVADGTIVDWYRNKELNGVDIGGTLGKRCGVKFLIFHDMKAYAVAGEKYCGEHCHSSASILLDKNSVGMGLMLDGKPLAGYNGCAGELRSLPVGVSGASNLVHTAVKLIQSVTAVYNPQYVVLYLPRKQEKFEAIKRAAQKNIPPYALPEIVAAGDHWLEDVFEGLYMCCLKHIKDML